MNTIDSPVILKNNIILKIEQQVVRGHETTSKKMSAHPVILALGFKKISVLPMTENMDKEQRVRLHPGRYFTEE
jgi:hypothetical protein